MCILTAIDLAIYAISLAPMHGIGTTLVSVVKCLIRIRVINGYRVQPGALLVSIPVRLARNSCGM